MLLYNDWNMYVIHYKTELSKEHGLQYQSSPLEVSILGEGYFEEIKCDVKLHFLTSYSPYPLLHRWNIWLGLEIKWLFEHILFSFSIQPVPSITDSLLCGNYDFSPATFGRIGCREKFDCPLDYCSLQSFASWLGVNNSCQNHVHKII